MWCPLVAASRYCLQRWDLAGQAGVSQAHRTWKRGWRWASLFHFMQTLTHSLRDLKNTLTHMTSVPHLPMRHRVGSAGPKASILILEQGSSVGPGSREEQRPFSPDESAQTGQRPQSREAPLSRPIGNRQAGQESFTVA